MTAVPAEVSVTEIHFDGLTWDAQEAAQFWLLHPPASAISSTAPFHHPTGPACPFAVLEAALAESIRLAHTGPVFFVVPELSIDPSRTAEVRDLIRQLPPNYVLIGGMGHLTAAQCDTIEPAISSTGALWGRSWAPSRYANAAIVGSRESVFLEAKHWPSKFEQDADCHMPHRRIRVFTAGDVRFAVVICSEMLTTPLPAGFVPGLVGHDLDVLFWIQHNPMPRHDLFREPLRAFYQTQGQRTLIVSVNKRPDPLSRKPYGVSAFIAPASSFAARKENLLRPNWACEPLATAATRAVLLRYDADVHMVSSIRPRDIPTSDPPGRFLETTEPYVFDSGAITVSPMAQHVEHLLTIGRAAAAAEAALGTAHMGPAGLLPSVEEQLKTSANLLSNLMDSALIQSGQTTHDNHASHAPAGLCPCWPHRENFDLLYQGDLPVAVSELALAVATLRASGISVQLDPIEATGNVRLAVGTRSRIFLLGWSTLGVADFISRYRPSPGSRFSATPTIVLRAQPAPPTLPASAGTVPPVGHIHAAQVAAPTVPSLAGQQFWTLARSSGLHDRIEEMAA